VNDKMTKSVQCSTWQIIPVSQPRLEFHSPKPPSISCIT